jgi:phosphohistidine phosphatase
MYAYLIRHGDAVAASENPGRPLSLRGRQDVERTVRLALRHNVAVSVVYHSGLLRALQTAEIVAALLAPPLGVKEHSGLLPDDDPAIVKAELDMIEYPIALVGHLPYLRRLAALLTTGDPDRHAVDFAPAMMACFAKEGGRWKSLWTSAEPAI